MKNVVFLQSWYSTITDNWYGWLKEELDKKGYQTHFIDLPEMRKDVPDMNVMLCSIESLRCINEDTVLIGHSLGCLLALHLAETHSVDKIILIAGWDYDDLEEGHVLFWKERINHEQIKEHTKQRVVIHSDNDPYVTQITAQSMAKRLGAEFILIPGGGHLTEKTGFTTLPQIMKFI